jgi:hypothetical protein
VKRSKYYLKREGWRGGGAHALRRAATALLRRAHTLHEWHGCGAVSEASAADSVVPPYYCLVFTLRFQRAHRCR